MFGLVFHLRFKTSRHRWRRCNLSLSSAPSSGRSLTYLSDRDTTRRRTKKSSKSLSRRQASLATGSVRAPQTRSSRSLVNRLGYRLCSLDGLRKRRRYLMTSVLSLRQDLSRTSSCDFNESDMDLGILEQDVR